MQIFSVEANREERRKRNEGTKKKRRSREVKKVVLFSETNEAAV